MSISSLHPACSLLLEVYDPISLDEYDAEDYAGELVAWEVSTDPAHPFPYLLAPRQYAEQEIDAIQCTASIGTIEVGVIDKPEVSGDQTTGYVSARVHDLLGRRCRLRRWINDDIGYVVIADGPAGPPRMDSTYAAYRWTIRDTRDTERKMAAFNTGGVACVAPRGPLYGFGLIDDESAGDPLLPRVLDNPIVGTYNLTSVGFFGKQQGLVNFASHFSGDFLSPDVDTETLVVTEAGKTACQISELSTNVWGARFADILWRVLGDEDWNIARMTTITGYLQPMAGFLDAIPPGGTELVPCLNFVTLFVDDEIPEGFPTVDGVQIEVIVRYRGPASEDFPYYVEGPLGEVLQNMYNGKYSLLATDEITGLIYDPAQLDADADQFISRIQYDPDAFDEMLEHVTLRQTEVIDDVRGWTETNLYAPSGWIPALDNEMHISPISRNRPDDDDIDPENEVNDGNCEPAPNWNQGQRTVSQVTYTYKRWFIPAPDAGIEVTEYDGLAVRDVTIIFKDTESELRYGQQIEEYDASAFSAIGNEDGENIAGVNEQASLLAQTANFDVLERFRGGVQSIAVNVLRSYLPNVRAGSWVPWDLSWLPDRATGLRESISEGAQIVSIRDDDCVWRTIVLEESGAGGAVAGAPGFVDSLVVESDEDGSGFSDGLVVFSDEESA